MSQYSGITSLLEQRRREVPGGAVAGVHHDLQRHGDGDVADELVEVVGGHIALQLVSAALAELPGEGDLAQALDVAAGHGLALQVQLDPVVLRRVVAAGHDQRRGRILELVRGEVGQRGRHEADVDDVAPRLQQCALQAGLDAAAAGAAVVAEDEGLLAQAVGQGADGGADAVDRVVVELRVGDAADVVGAEDMRRQRLRGARHRLAARGAGNGRGRRSFLHAGYAIHARPAQAQLAQAAGDRGELRYLQRVRGAVFGGGLGPGHFPAQQRRVAPGHEGEARAAGEKQEEQRQQGLGDLVLEGGNECLTRREHHEPGRARHGGARRPLTRVRTEDPGFRTGTAALQPLQQRERAPKLLGAHDGDQQVGLPGPLLPRRESRHLLGGPLGQGHEQAAPHVREVRLQRPAEE